MNFDNLVLKDNNGIISKNFNIPINTKIQSMSFNQNESLFAIANNKGFINIYKLNNYTKIKNNFNNYFINHLVLDNNNDIEKNCNINKQIHWSRDQQNKSFIFSVSSSNVKLWKFSNDKFYNKNVTKYKEIYNLVNLNQYNIPYSNFNLDTKLYQNKKIELDLIRNFSINVNEESFITNSYKDINITLIELVKTSKLYSLDIFENNIFFIKSICNPKNDQIYAYGKSNSEIGIIDNRISLKHKNRLSIITQSNNLIYNLDNNFLNILTDIKYTNDSRYIVIRYLNSITVWDALNFKEPLFQKNLISNKLISLYNEFNNYEIKKNHQIEISKDDSFILTSIQNNLILINIINQEVKIYNISNDSKTIWSNDLNSRILFNDIKSEFVNDFICLNNNNKFIITGNDKSVNIISII